jgi:hypothetical protein
MLVKIYWSIWALFLAASFILFAAGAMTSFVLVVLGFFAFGLTFMGMMGVLPAMVSHPAPKKEAKVQRTPAAPARQATHAEGFGRLKSA